MGLKLRPRGAPVVSSWDAMAQVQQAEPDWAPAWDGHACEVIARHPDHANNGIEIRGEDGTQVIARLRAFRARYGFRLEGE